MFKKIISGACVITALMATLAIVERIAMNNNIKNSFSSKLDDDDIM